MPRMEMGNGKIGFAVVEGWGTLPDRLAYGYTHGIVVDSRDNVYVLHTGKPSVVVFDRDGRYVSAWGDQFAGGAHGLYLHREAAGEFLYITDKDRARMVKTTLDGEVVLTLHTPNLPDVYDAERKYKPTDAAVAPNGDIYVTDGYGQYWVHHYDAGGNYIRSWGGKGTEPGKLDRPHGISIDLRRSEPEIYVADRGNHRIQVFGLNGEHRRFIREHVDRPCSFYFHRDDMYVPDLHSRVTLFDAHDRLIVHLGEDPEARKQAGWPNLPKSYFRADKFSSPHAVCVDSEGSVYVAEWISDGRITKLAKMHHGDDQAGKSAP